MTKRCGAPACSATIPEQLDERGPRGWFDLVVTLRPLGEGFATQLQERVRLCPACRTDPLLVASLALVAAMKLKPR